MACRHDRIRGIYGDEINGYGGARSQCLDCRKVFTNCGPTRPEVDALTARLTAETARAITAEQRAQEASRAAESYEALYVKETARAEAALARATAAEGALRRLHGLYEEAVYAWFGERPVLPNPTAVEVERARWLKRGDATLRASVATTPHDEARGYVVGVDLASGPDRTGHYTPPCQHPSHLAGYAPTPGCHPTPASPAPAKEGERCPTCRCDSRHGSAFACGSCPDKFHDASVKENDDG